MLLPTDILFTVAEFADTQTCGRLGTTSSTVRTIINTELFRGNDNPRRFERLTIPPYMDDQQMDSLLKRIHAKEVTRFLYLLSCHRIRGSGFAAMKNSQVLEEVKFLSTGIDAAPTPHEAGDNQVCINMYINPCPNLRSIQFTLNQVDSRRNKNYATIPLIEYTIKPRVSLRHTIIDTRKLPDLLK